MWTMIIFKPIHIMNSSYLVYLIAIQDIIQQNNNNVGAISNEDGYNNLFNHGHSCLEIVK